jgi:hypothetical protein
LKNKGPCGALFFVLFFPAAELERGKMKHYSLSFVYNKDELFGNFGG